MSMVRSALNAARNRLPGAPATTTAGAAARGPGASDGVRGDARIDRAVAEHRAADPHVRPNDLLEEALVYGDRAKLHLHPSAVVNNALFNLSSGEITVGEYAFFGHNVSVLTGTHDINTFDRERQVAVPKSGRDVVIERGAWVSSNALVLGPCTIGEHAVVAAASVVVRDVPPYTVVAGTPAKPVKTIPRPGEPADGAGTTGEAAGTAGEQAAEGSLVGGGSGDGAAGAVPGGAPAGFAALYPAFQERFRGSEAEVRSRLDSYLPDADRFSTGARVLDVGPGRGEWLAMLAERGIAAYGVEANPALAEHVRGRGLEVVDGDALAHLQGLEPGSLDLVTAFHVIEHVPVDSLVPLLHAARRALRPGGGLILESPDPTNLVMGACNFYFDPTHLRPVPPALAEFLVRASGFRDLEVRPLHPKEQVDFFGLRLDGLDERTTSLLAGALYKAFFGPQDYAVLAVAGSDGGS